jgi:hypothetical protein
LPSQQRSQSDQQSFSTNDDMSFVLAENSKREEQIANLPQILKFALNNVPTKQQVKKTIQCMS